MAEQIEGMDHSVDVRFHLFQPLGVSIFSSMILLLEFSAFSQHLSIPDQMPYALRFQLLLGLASGH